MWINFEARKKEKQTIKLEDMNLSMKTDWGSSMIASTKYEPSDKKMHVTFTNGNSYTYSEIHLEEYVAFCIAESQGKHFNENFKNKKPFVKDDDQKS